MAKKNKSILKSTTSLVGTALVGTALVFSAFPALAANITVNDDTTTQQQIDEGGFFRNRADVNVSDDSAVVADVGSSTFIENDGGIITANSDEDNTVAGIHIFDGHDLTGSIINNGEITGINTYDDDMDGTGYGYGILIDSGSGVGGSINNASSSVVSYFYTEINGTDAAIALFNNSYVTGGINNNTAGALISGGITGIEVSDSSIGGGISNSGSIIGVLGDGISLYDGAGISGALSNSGTISGGEHGISINYDSDIINDGHGIQNTNLISGGYDGININDGSDILSELGDGINNSGTILATGAEGNAAIYINDSSVTANDGYGINNSGLILSDDDDGYGIYAENNATISGAEGGIYNSGTIEATGGEGEGAAIYLDDSSVTATDGYGIYNTGLISAEGLNAHGIHAIESTITGNEGGIYNSGTIQAGAAGVYLGYNTTGTGSDETYYGSTVASINNSGLISGGDTGVRIDEATISGSITNSGSIISVNEHAIDIDESLISGSITNNGSALIMGDSEGLHVGNSTVVGGISNSGSIIGIDDDGVHIDDSSISGGITNAAGALIHGQGLASGTSSTGGTGLIISGSTISGGISNSGSILGADENAGIDVEESIISDGITNAASALIQGGETGISISSSTISGGINNSGSIIGTASEALYVTDSSISGGINNSGVMVGGEEGIYLEDTIVTGGITNNASALISGGTMAGISINSGSEINGGISNSGSVIGDSYGIYSSDSEIYNGNVDGSGIFNDGLIQADSGTPDGIGNAGIYLHDTTISADGYGIHNTGTIEVIGGEGGNGIYVAGSTVTGEEGGIYNSGEIYANNGGIVVTTYSTTTGSGTPVTTSYGSTVSSINNSGLISAGDTGVEVSDSTVTGSITNSGTIFGSDEYGINVNESLVSGDITNAEGKIIISGVSGDQTGTGINIDSSTITGSISNSGSIIGYEEGEGISINASSIGGGISNGSVGVVLGGSTGISISSSIISGGITNSGTITGESDDAVRITNGSLVSNAITNNASALISGDNTGILIDNSTVSGGIANSGDIYAEDEYGIDAVGSVIVGNITNAEGAIISSGISGEEGEDGTGINIDSSTITGSISNSGSIIGYRNGNGINIIDGSEVAGISNGSVGVILGGDTGIYVDGSTVTSGIANSGSIYGGDGYGIFIDTGSSVSGGITNTASAQIIGGDTGLYINHAAISGDIANSGSIIGYDGYGIGIVDDSSVTGSITNAEAGIVQGDDTGIFIDSSIVAGSIFNSGSIVGSNGAGLGIHDSSISDFDDTIENEGLISGGDYGIYLTDTSIESVDGDGIYNSGTITATAGGEGYSGIYIHDSSITAEDSHGIHNTETGLIEGGESSDSNAIYISGSVIAGDDDAIINEGTITGNKGGIVITAYESTSEVFVRSTLSGSLNNSGLISAGDTGIEIIRSTISGDIANSGSISGDYGYGINIHTSSIIDGDITNQEGAIITGGALDDESATGIRIDSSTVTGAISNSGSIIGIHNVGTTTEVAGFGILISDSSVSGGITNSASSLVSGGDTGIKIVDSSIGDITNNGTISGGVNAMYMEQLHDTVNIEFGEDATIIGGVHDEDYTDGYSIVSVLGDVTTTGDWQVSDLTIAEDKTFFITHDHSLTLNTMSDSTGTFQFGIETAEDHANLYVTDGAINLTDASVTVYASNLANLADGEEIKIGEGADAVLLDWEGKQTVTDNSFLYNFQIGDGTNATTVEGSEDDLYAFVTKNTFAGVNTGAGDAIWNLNQLDDDLVNEVLANLDAASPAEKERILESINPTSDGNSFVASVNIVNSITTISDTRLASLRDGDPSSGIATGSIANSNNAWAQVFGKKANQDERGGVSGYTADTQGIALGFDTGLDSDVASVGLALGLSNTDIASESLNRTDTEVASYQVSFYSDYRINDRTFVEGSVGFVYGNSTSMKHDVGGTGAYAEGEYDSQQITAQAKLGRNYQLGGTKLTLSTLAHYVDYKEDAYTETGNAGVLLLEVEDREVQQFELGVGADFSWDLNMANGYILRPSTNFGYRHEFLDESFAATSTFTGGGTFTTDGLNPADDVFSAGAGLKLINSNTWDVSLDYGFEYREDYDSHTGTLKAGYKF